MKKVEDNEVLYHLGLSKDMIEFAEYAILINDKKYVEQIAQLLDPKAKYINENREYYSCLANFNKQKVLVMSTGLGAPAMAIGIEEMVMIGLRHFVRLGETGAIQHNMDIGDLVLSKAAVRFEETSKHYAPANYPAVASLEMTNIFYDVLAEKKLNFHCGVTVSTDTYWPTQGGKTGYLKYVPRKFQNILDEWRHLNILSVDLELAALFTICNVFFLRSCCCS